MDAIAEPVQGEAGAIVPPDDYWPRLRTICDKYDVLLDRGRQHPRRYVLDQRSTDRQRCWAIWGHAPSGIGRELGIEGLEGFRDTKHVHMDYKIRAMPDWFPYDWSSLKKS